MALGKKTGGRVKGSVNRSTKNIRFILGDLLEESLNGLQEDLKALEPKERLEVMIKLLPYVSPKIDSVKYNDPDSAFNIEEWDNT
ncbi:hypothetical protein EI427_05640 [Flammeovirga pectinis]|uniref:DUF5681 domain-containing protein n=1 Tax=Flammeovirga pectinis TaxID=2494373 RepID=A0A3S9P0L5_9BACT|nr:hypothetical protein [Flammeovirga pectinis]AZQ61734.1 hypothetical protein EI427_05640 [Flammeovirga pectinis]